MSGKEPVFRWDAYGISAYDAIWYEDGQLRTISGVNSKKFVRFDKYGIYGIDSEQTDGVVIDGSAWTPESSADIDKYSTFALTWEGLKVAHEGNNTKGVVRIGKHKIKVDGIEK
jgi:hypothetical protein